MSRKHNLDTTPGNFGLPSCLESFLVRFCLLVSVIFIIFSIIFFSYANDFSNQSKALVEEINVHKDTYGVTYNKYQNSWAYPNGIKAHMEEIEADRKRLAEKIDGLAAQLSESKKMIRNSSVFFSKLSKQEKKDFQTLREYIEKEHQIEFDVEYFYEARNSKKKIDGCAGSELRKELDND